MIGPPSDADQLLFLTRFQRILDEGQFVATYKFALLLALIEIAIERGDDSGRSLDVPLEWIAEKFIELYWGHTRDFCGAVLVQNKGANIAVLSRIERLQRHTMLLAEARRHPQWAATVRPIVQIVRTMPLFRVQLLRGDERIPFLYDEAVEGGAIRLKPGVVCCLRRFSMLLGALARNGWLREVRANPKNAYAIGATQDLEEFLFGSERVPLAHVREVLLPIQRGRCFYCAGPMQDVPHVDHFIPWALYPSNLGHNLVLADAGCNGDKSDLLADVPHLARWRDRNREVGAQLGQAFAGRGIVTDLDASSNIARWAYDRARLAKSLVWVGRRETRPLPVRFTFDA